MTFKPTELQDDGQMSVKKFEFKKISEPCSEKFWWSLLGASVTFRAAAANFDSTLAGA